MVAEFFSDYSYLVSGCLPEETIVETAEYKTLLSHFNILYNEATQLKTQLLESRAIIVDMKTSHARQIERMEQNETMVRQWCDKSSL